MVYFYKNTILEIDWELEDRLVGINIKKIILEYSNLFEFFFDNKNKLLILTNINLISLYKKFYLKFFECK